MIYNTRLCGVEAFEFEGTRQPVSVIDFWSWAMSRLVMDGPRGDLAEFIVRVALSGDIDTPKCGWGEYDIDYRGKRVEVKCSSMLQAWRRETPSAPKFGIASTTNCMVKQDEAGEWYYHGSDGSPARRRSDLYVFCLFANSDLNTADLLKLEQWVFWVLATSVINEQLGERKSITMPLMEKLGAEKLTFSSLKPAVDKLIAEIETS